MEVLQTRADLRAFLSDRRDRRRILVPTMGALHRGHTSLLDIAAARDDGDVIASIFVNPTQFGPHEDFDAYPRQPEKDLALCEEHGVVAVFQPRPGEIYAPDASVTISENRLSTGLCGASRPGHFDGVCTVVAKLFHLTRADVAVFGEKDFQQLAVIRRLVRDLDLPVEIVAGPTVREADGLALSSRNAYLSPDERQQAPVIHRALSLVADGIARGSYRHADEARRDLAEEISTAPLARIDYVEVVDSSNLEPLRELTADSRSGSIPRLLAAVHFGNTRLIDNVGVPALNGELEGR